MALTAAASLKLDKVLANGLKVFKRRLVPLLAFSTRFQASELAKDKSLQVPYVDLDATASSDWDPETGYGEGSFTIGSRPVPVDKRKFQALSWQSGDLLGLPQAALDWAMEQKVEKLASDVITDILSVVTLANFGAHIFAGAASGFDADDISDISNDLDGLNWPDAGRAAVLHQDYVTAVSKDPAVRNAQASGSTDALRLGSVGQISNVDVMKGVNFPANGENLVGCVALPSAILVAAAPVTPDAEVRSQLQDFRTVTDKDTGLTLVYRAWGNPDLDKCKRVVEFSYGYAKGDEKQLKRILSQEP